MNIKKQKNILSYIQPLLWIVPFICFFSGYFIFSFFIPQDTFLTPSLLGKSGTQALCILSNHNLHAQIIAEKEDATLPSGTIISQTPHPLTKLKSHQTVYLVISKKPILHNTPHYTDTLLETCIKEAHTQNIKLRVHPLPHIRIEETCLAQIPLPGTPLEHDIVTIYTAHNKDCMVIMPLVKGKTVEEIKTSFASYPITITVHHTNIPHESSYDYSQCIVKEQKPLPGSLVNLHKPLRVQLTL